VHCTRSQEKEIKVREVRVERERMYNALMDETLENSELSAC
jgi:hypothetical protein